MTNIRTPLAQSVPFNGQPQMADFDFEKAKEAEKMKLEMAAENLKKIELKQAESEKNRRESLRVERQEYQKNIQYYREQANKAQDKDEANKFLKWAEDEQKMVNDISLTLDDAEPAPQEYQTTLREKLTSWLFSHTSSWILQIMLLIGAAIFCYNKVLSEKERIMKINTFYQEQGTTSMMIAPPLDERDIQQVWFDKYQLTGDLAFAFFILLLLSPHILSSILFFIPNSTIQKIWPTYFALPEISKQWLSYAWSALVLLVTVMSHQHK